MKQKSLELAKKNKNDEFYTLIEDIEKEVNNHKESLKDKIVYCNCDNIEKSQFYIYFLNNIIRLKIRSVYFTSIERHDVIEISIGENNEVIIRKKELNELGSFNSEGCLEILKKSDIVITNPPFSLFRNFIEVMENNNKKYLIIGSQNAIGYRDVFRLIENKKLRLGYTYPKEFITHEGSIKKFGNICWFTNLPVKKSGLIKSNNKQYKGNEDFYQKYDNYNAIDVSKLKDIPNDYNGVMGVPITFLMNFNEEEYRIVGINDGNYDHEIKPTKKYIKPIQVNQDGTETNGSKMNTRSMLEIKNLSKHDKAYYKAENSNKKFRSIYSRILIKKIK